MSLNYELIHGLDFTQEEIDASVARGGLLSLELEFTRKCNLRCIYCYSEAGEGLDDELTVDEIKGVVEQAKELGAKKIIILGGGEPLLYKGLREVVVHIDSLGLEQTIFTNGILLTEDLARFFYDHKVSVIVKHNSSDPKTQDSLAGVEGTYDKMQNAVGYLQKVGYPDSERQLGIQTVIVKQNLAEIPDMWTWARENNIIPYFEILTIQGRARVHSELAVTGEEVRDVFEKLEKVDADRFGFEWHAHPTIASFTCKRHLYSCLVNSQGFVQPCTGVDLFVGNVREKGLGEILSSSRVISDLRSVYDKLEGACGDCASSCECYGCRGNAYQTTGNYLAADPACWIENDEKDKTAARKAANISLVK